MSLTTSLPRKSSFFFSVIRVLSHVRLIDIMFAILAIELIAGGIIMAREMIAAQKLRGQIAQISRLNAAVSVFNEKFGGLPGDLLSAQADRTGLPTGDGTPAHSDGDGKISPCSPGWQEGLGCETALFWTQLTVSELVEGTFTANLAYADTRVEEENYLLENYLPKAALSNDLYITVWSSERKDLSSGKYLPDGNYFELTALRGIEDSKLVDDPHSISPLIAREIDKKIDDGAPFSGSVVVNGNTNLSEASWGNFAETSPLECVTQDNQYNTREYMKAHRALCHLAIAMDCCDAK